ncbi:MAG: hypothetical protein ABI821_02735 [Pseudomonadota bacterium]
MKFLMFLAIGVMLGFALRMFWRALRKTSAFTDHVASIRDRVRQEKANAPVFRDFLPQPDGRSYLGMISWLGKSVPIEVMTYERDSLKTLNAAYDEFLAQSVALDAEARETIASEVRNGESWLAKHLDRPVEGFLAGLALERVMFNDYQIFDLAFRGEMLGGIRVTVHGEMGDHERTVSVRGFGLKPAVMPLELGGESFAIESAKFTLSISTEEWDEEEQRWLYGPGHISANYSLEIIVDEHSGEDSAPSPIAQSIPVSRANGGRVVAPTALAGIEVDDEDDWDAWYGNDAPRLEANRIKFGAVSGNRVQLRWEAKYTWGRDEQPKSFIFDGDVELQALQISVKEEPDADKFVKAMFGEVIFQSLTKETGEWWQIDDSMPADRRSWLPVKYRPKA